MTTGTRSLEGIDKGLILWGAENFGNLFTKYGEPFYTAALSVIDDEQTDLTRIREVSTNNREAFPSAVQVRGKFQRFTHTRTTSPLYNFYETPQGLELKYKYIPVQIEYKWKLYCVNYTQACIFIERLAINWFPQYKFYYTVGDPQIDLDQNGHNRIHGTLVVKYPEAVTKPTGRNERNTTGSIHVVELPIVVYAVLFDTPEEGHLIHEIDLQILDYNNQVLDKFVIPGSS